MRRNIRIVGNEEGEEVTFFSFDMYGNPVTETIRVRVPRRLRLRDYVMRYAPKRIWNIWYQLGWTNIRRITSISVTNK